jgi:hypothetical protein
VAIALVVWDGEGFRECLSEARRGAGTTKRNLGGGRFGHWSCSSQTVSGHLGARTELFDVRGAGNSIGEPGVRFPAVYGAHRRDGIPRRECKAVGAVSSVPRTSPYSRLGRLPTCVSSTSPATASLTFSFYEAPSSLEAFPPRGSFGPAIRIPAPGDETRRPARRFFRSAAVRLSCLDIVGRRLSGHRSGSVMGGMLLARTLDTAASVEKSGLGDRHGSTSVRLFDNRRIRSRIYRWFARQKCLYVTPTRFPFT